MSGFEIDVVLAELVSRSAVQHRKYPPALRTGDQPVPAEADPLHLSRWKMNLLRPMRIQDGHTEYSVDNIISSRHRQSGICALFSFRHRGGMLRHDSPERYYHTR